MREVLPSLQQFEFEVRRLTGDHPDARPFLCNGNPYPSDLMLVGLNPGVAIPFWRHWSVTNGCDKAGWLEAYRNLRRRYGPTRRRIELLFEGLSNYRCVEANLYPFPSKRLSDLPREFRSTALFQYLLEVIRPQLLFVHGADAVANLRSRGAAQLTLDRPMGVTIGRWSGTVYATRHLSYHWRDADVVTLGSTLDGILSPNSGPNFHGPRETTARVLTRYPHSPKEALLVNKNVKNGVQQMVGRKRKPVSASRNVSNQHALVKAGLDEDEVLELHAGLIQRWRNAIDEMQTHIVGLQRALATVHKISTSERSRASAGVALDRISKIAGEGIGVTTSNDKLVPAKTRKRKPNAAFMKAMTPSTALAAIVGAQPMPRTEVTRRVWDYIKEHKLQDTHNPRRIHADLRLKKILGGNATVSINELTRVISNHLK